MLWYDINPNFDIDEVVDELTEMGYREDQYGEPNKPIHINKDNTFEAIKTLEGENIAVTIKGGQEDISVEVYRYNGQPDKHVSIEFLEEYTYIKELIERGILVDE